MRPSQLPPAAASSNHRGSRRRLDLTLPLRSCKTPPLAVPLPLPGPTDQPIPFSELARLYRIGSGSCGIVYKVVHRPSSGRYALKVIRGQDEELIRRQVRREVQIFRGVDDPNVVKCLELYDHNGQYQFLLEFFDRGSLEGRHIPHEHRLADLARQVLCGLAYLQRHHIVHRAIRPSNFLINSLKQVKIADFQMGPVAGVTSPVDTTVYMSPERIIKNIDDGQYNGYAGDIWSLGVSILELYLGRLPFSVGIRGDWATLMHTICTSQPPEAPSTASPEFRDFISKCLQREASRRWSATQLLTHPFITQGVGHQNHQNSLQLPPPPGPLST